MNILTKRRFSLFFEFICLILISCSTGDQKRQKVSGPITVVEFPKLVSQIGEYQGKVVQIKGLYISAFEKSAIYGLDSIPDSSHKRYPTNHLPGIWVEFEIDRNRPKSQILKSLPKSNTIATIQGIIDTTNKGHLNQYAAALVNAILISSEE